MFCLFVVCLFVFKIPLLPCHLRLAENEDKCDSLAATLQLKEEMLNTVTCDKSRADKETSSRMANLNLALAQAKRACTQLTEQVEAHKAKEWELINKIEDLELATGSQESNIKSRPRCEMEKLISGTPVRRGSGWSFQSSCTPSKPLFPAETELDSLRSDNKKLKQDLSCLQTNFELISHKSTQLRNKVKELESSMSELQKEFDKNLDEKEKLQSRLEEISDGFKNQTGSQATDKKKIVELTEQVQEFQHKIDHLQQQNLNLQADLKNGLDQTFQSQNMIDKLDSVKKSLSDEQLAMQGEMDALHKELEELQDKCHALENSTSTHEEYKKKNSGIIKTLKSKMSKLTKEKSELSGQLIKASEMLNQAHDKIHLHMEEVKALQVDLKAKKKENVTLSAQREDQSHLPVEVEKLRAKVIETIEEMDDLRSSNDSHVAARDRLESKVAELSKANNRLSREWKHGSELAQKVNAELERTEERVQSLEIELEAVKKERDLVQHKLKGTKSELSKLANIKIERETETKKLLENLSELEQKNFELTTELTSRQGEADIVKESRLDIEHKRMELESKLDAAQFVILEKESQMSDLKCAYDLMEAENSTLLSQVTSLSEMVSTRNFKLEAQQVQSVHYESEVLEIMERISELESEHGSCADTIGKLRESNDELRESLEMKVSLEHEMQGTISSLKVEVEKMNKSNAVLKSDNSDLQDEISSQVAKSKEFNQKFAASEARVHRLEQNLKVESVALKAAREDLGHAKKTHQETEAEMGEKIERLETKLTDMELQHDAFHREKVELKSRVTDLRAELKEHTLLSSSLKIQRDSLSEQYESLKESALSVLQSECAAADVSLGEENPPPARKTRDLELRSILKKPRPRKVLTPLQNLQD